MATSAKRIGLSSRVEAPLLALSLAMLVLGGFVTGCGGGEAPPAGSRPAEALRSSFPEHAARILGHAEAFSATDAGFSLPLLGDPAKALGRRGGLSMTLPRRAEDAIRFHLVGGFELRVREDGASGDGALVEGAVAYPRAGGTSFWTVTDAGYEEWLHVRAGVATGREPVATWEVDGAGLRESNGVVEILGAGGVARVRVKAPIAFGDGGRVVPTRLAARGARIELWADAAGEALLVDPVWTTTGSMSTPRTNHTATLLRSYKVLVAGGYDDTSTRLAGAELYDPVTGTWSSASPMNAARAEHTATLLLSGRVLVAGGAEGATPRAEVYDPATDTWTATGDMHENRIGHVAALLPNGQVLAAGGAMDPCYSFLGCDLQDAELYDPATSTWSSTGSMNQPRTGFTATTLGDGTVLVAGGVPEWSPRYVHPHYWTTEIYDPVSGTWSYASNMSTARGSHAATLLLNGRVLVTGGTDGVSSLDTAEIYDPVAGTWTLTPSLPSAVDSHTATSLQNGQVLVAGGEQDDVVVSPSPSPLYDPVAGNWSTPGSLNTARLWHTATLIGPSTVLVAGGCDDGGNVLASAELFQAGSGTCYIGGAFYAPATVNPANPCQVCAPSTSTTAWSNQADGTACDDGNACTQGDSCQAGACAGTPPASGDCQVFVATNGDDAGPGTMAQPFATLERARDYVRTLHACATGPVNVCLRAGTYELARTFALGAADSGTAAAPVTYRSYPGEQATLSGGVEIAPQWQPYSGAIYVADMNRSFNQLFVNGVRAVRARSPNGDLSYTLAPVTGGASPSAFLYASGDVPDDLSRSDVEIVSMARWISPRQRVASTNGIKVTTDGPVFPYYGYDYASNDRYYVENTLSALDSPGEWYLDQAAHKLYYWPRDPQEILNGTFVVPRLHQLVSGGAYPENTAWNRVGEDRWGTCRHLGVYPQPPDLLSFPTESFTVSAWLQFPAGTANPFWVFTKGDPWSVDGYGLGAYSTGDTVPVQFFVNDGAHQLSTSLPSQPRAQWFHVAFVVDRAAHQMRSYLDGALGQTVDISALGSIGSTLPLDLGAYTNAGCFRGAIDDFRIYAAALSSAQVAALLSATPPDQGLVLSLPFDGDFRDQSPLRNDTVAFYAPSFVGHGTGQAADFSSSSPLDLSGAVDYIGFSGLTFQYADWVIPFTGYPGDQAAIFWTSPSAVYLHGHHAVVTNNTFQHLGSHALGGMLGSSLVADNEFSDLGGGAIRIGQSIQSDTDDVALSEFSSNDTLTGNQIHDTGIVVHDSAQITIFRGENNDISHNTLTRAPNLGISAGWFSQTASPPSFGDNRICYNSIDSVMQLMNDGGGIYVNGSQSGTTIDHNIVHDVVATPAHDSTKWLWGIYLDGTSRGMLVRDNLVYRTQQGGIMLNDESAGSGTGGGEGEGNVVTNNIFVDGLEDELTFVGAVLDSSYGNIVYDGRASCPNLVYPSGSILDSQQNLFYFAPRASCPTPPGDLSSQLATWESVGHEHCSVVADPQFVDYANDNFTLSPTSPALLPVCGGGIGFSPIVF